MCVYGVGLAVLDGTSLPFISFSSYFISSSVHPFFFFLSLFFSYFNLGKPTDQNNKDRHWWFNPFSCWYNRRHSSVSKRKDISNFNSSHICHERGGVLMWSYVPLPILRSRTLSCYCLTTKVELDFVGLMTYHLHDPLSDPVT
jgi:hypothetical protein